MNNQPSSKIWVYVSAIPSIFVTLGVIITSTAYVQLWGGSTKAAYVFAIFFAEISIVIGAAGLLTYHLRIREKNLLARTLSKINWCIILSAIAIGLYLFLG